MLQQTQVKTVLGYWERWMKALPDVRSLAAAKPGRAHKLWEGLGYYTRVRNMQKAARQIVAEHGGEFPQDFEAVLALPGIGRYTAGAICSIAFNQPAPILDGNVTRVLTRLFGIGGDPRERPVNDELWTLAEALVQEAARMQLADSRRTGGACSHLNQSLMELGALVCTPRQPRCASCPVARRCVAFRRNLVANLPQPRRRPRAVARRFVAFVVEKRGRLLVRQRPAGVVNAHLWEFPNTELEAGDCTHERAAREVLGCAAVALEPLCIIKHSITRYRITLEVLRATLDGANVAPRGGKWLGPAELRRLPFASAHKKILLRLGGA